MLQTLASIAQIGGGLALLVAAGSYLIHRNQLNFNMITSCNQRFQDILVDMEGEDESKAKRAKKRYVDLCSEQLFYFKKGYLPREVMEEWLESMVDYLPLFDNVTDQVRGDHSGRIEPDLLEGYPTIRKVFAVDGPYDPTSREQRLTLVQQIGKSVRPESVPIVLWRDFVDHFSRPDRGNK